MRHDHFSIKRIVGFTCKPGKSQTIFWDGYAPGLGLRVTRAGSKSYIFEAWLHGRCLRITIGDQRTWTLGKAQDEATRFKTLTDQGIDPRKLASEQEAVAGALRRKERTAETLVSDAWAVYVKERAPKWGAQHLRDHRMSVMPGGQKKKRGKTLTVAGALYPLMGSRLVEISAQTLIDMLKREVPKRRAVAKTGFKLFRTFWNWCSHQDAYSSVVDTKMLENPNLRGEVPADRTHRQDVLQRAHLKPWFSAVSKLDNQVASAYLQTMVLTGARRSEMTELRWSDVDFVFGTLHLKDKVEETGRDIPLTPYVSQLLSALPRVNNWVFSSLKAAAGRLIEPASAHNRALAAAGLKHVTIQGLRRSYSSLGEWIDLPIGVKAQVQGHKPSATAEKHYTERPLELLAIWHRKYEAWILQEAGVKVPGNRKRTKHVAEDQRKLRLVSSQ